MDAGQIIGDVITGTFTLAAAAIGAVAVRRAGQAHSVGQANALKLDKVVDVADDVQAERISRAVSTYAADHPGLISEAVATEAMRDLLDALIGANLTPAELETLRRRGREARRVTHSGE